MTIGRSFTLKLAQDPSGRLILSDTRIADGIVWVVISCIPGFIGFLGVLVILFMRPDPSAPPPRPPDLGGTDLFLCLGLLLVGLLGILRGIYVVISRTRVLFDRARQQVLVQKVRPGRVDEEAFAYADVRLEVSPTVTGADWKEYEASIVYPSGRLVVARHTALSRIDTFAEDFRGRTGLLGSKIEKVW